MSKRSFFKKKRYQKFGINLKNLQFEIIETPENQTLEFLTQKINEETADKGTANNFAIIAHDGSGKIVAGCNGSVIFGSVYTDQLWVHLSLRGLGIGTQLMEHVHQYGKKQGCKLATVTTMNDQVRKVV